MVRNRFLIIPFILLALTLLSASVIFAVITPAGTQIRNRSSATYEDMVGNTFTTTSNEVITIVLPVYGLTILPDDSGETPPAVPAMSQNALAGLTVYYRYDVTNTGNDNDSFSLVPIVDGGNTTMGINAADVTIYNDLNFNGVLDVGEPMISAGGVPGNLGPIATGATASIIVSYTVPVAAVTGDVAYVGVEGISVGDPLQIDTRNYHLTTVVNDAVMTANFTGLPAVVFEGNQITYTLSGTNTGNNSANGVTVGSVGLTGVLLYDIIPVDPNTTIPLPLFGAPAAAPAGGMFIYLNAGNATAGSPETWNWSLVPGPNDIAIGYVTGAAIVPGQSYSFAYQVTVPAGMPAGVLNNDAALAYVDNDPVTPDPTIVVSNNAPVTIGIVADVLIGPVGDPGAGSPPNFNDDVTTVATASAGSSVDFTNTIRNDGNAADDINVILDGTSTIPGAWIVQFFEADGSTPLSDLNLDGFPDVNGLAVGASINIVVRLTIPGSQAAGGPFDAVIRAESVNDPTAFNLTTDRIQQVLAAGVDIGNYNGGPGTNNGSVNQNADPATSVDFALDVINTSGGMDTYTLSSTAPLGWVVTFYEDANGNGILDAGEMAPIPSIGPVAGLTEVNVIARVAVPAGALPGVNPVSFTATSTNNPLTSDTIANTVTVNSLAAVDFAPDLAGNSSPGGTIQYTHTITNTGNVGDTFDLTFVSSQGWTYVFYDALNNPITDVTLVPGASEVVTVRLTVPMGAPIGTVETGVLTATGQATFVSDDATDVTVIVAGNLTLTKTVNPLGNQPPGTELTYTTDYQNVGTADLTSVVIFDPIPAFTQYRVGSEAVGVPPAGITAITPEFSDDGGTTWTYLPVSGGGGAPVNFDANVTNVRFVMTGTVAAGQGSATGVSFTVRIIAE
jgi:uncharacterized repeat protein (TIGR01451 family)